MNNGLGIGGGEFIASALTEAARLNTESESPSNITTIVIGRNRLEKSAALIAKAVSLHENISVLGLPQNGIRPDVIVELFNHLSSLGKITTLDLQDNTFTLTGSRACAETIVNWKNSLCVLNVGECLLGEDGSILIIKALTGAFEKLQQLLLSYNEIDTQGAKLIPAMLSRKVYLVKLELNGNAFDADSDEVDDIRDALDSIGHSDALDELDDMEVSTDEEDDDDEDDVVENEVDDELVDAATKLAIT